jgi:hypothetical protein
MSTSTPAGDSARDQALRQFESSLANAGSSPTAAASAERVLGGQGLALQTAETTGVASLERVGAESAGQPEQQQAQYLVGVENRTSGIVFSQIVVAFRCTGSPNDEGIQATDVRPGRGVAFPLCSCSDLQAYAVFVAVGGDEPVQVIPPEGVMTAELASQLNPSDTDPCIDLWPFVDA